MKYRVKVMRRDSDRVCIAKLECHDRAMAEAFANDYDTDSDVSARVEICLVGSDERLHWVYADQISD